jgi:hypothetical protein
MSINRGLFVVFVAATMAVTAFGVANSAGGVIQISADNSESVVTRTYTPGDPSPVTIQTASALLAHPVYNTGRPSLRAGYWPGRTILPVLRGDLGWQQYRRVV